MNALDYAVLLGTMLGIAAFGIWRMRGRRDLNAYLKGGGEHEMVRDRAVGHGHAGQRSHVPVDAGAGISGWAGIRAELFRSAVRADRDLACFFCRSIAS